MSSTRIALLVAPEIEDTFKKHFAKKGATTTSISASQNVTDVLRDALRLKQPFTALIVDVSLQGIHPEDIVAEVLDDVSLRQTKLIVGSPDRQVGDAKSLLMCGYQGVILYSQLEVDSSLLEERSESAHVNKVLFLGSDRTSQKMIKFACDKIKVHYDEANSLTEAKSNMAGSIYDIVIIDCDSTSMDGYETTFEIRGLGGRYETIPIVGITSGRGGIPRPAEVGMTAIVKKPIMVQSFSETLTKVITEHCR